MKVLMEKAMVFDGPELKGSERLMVEKGKEVGMELAL